MGKKILKSGAKTQQRDNFAKLIAKGYTSKEAYLKAGYSEKQVDREAPRLMKEPDIRSAIYYYKSAYTKEFDITGKSILAVKAATAFVDPAVFLDDKNRPLPISKLPFYLRLAIKKLKVRDIKDKDGNIRETIHEYEFEDRKEALRELKEWKSQLIQENVAATLQGGTTRISIKVNGLERQIFRKGTDITEIDNNKTEDEDEDDV